MATKKKTAKKPVAKRAYTRKAPAAKRSYNRKPKAEPAQVVGEEYDQAQADVGVTKEAEAESTISILRQIDVIDLRGVDPTGRFSVLAALQKNGYITEQLESPISHDMIREYMFADALMLNHNNKLISAADWSRASSSYAISQPMVHFDAQIGFSRPKAEYEDTLRIGSARYVRVA